MKFKFAGDWDQYVKVITEVSPGGRWQGGSSIREYLTADGPKIRCWPNGTVFVQGKEPAATRLFHRLIQQVRLQGLEIA